MADAAAVYNDFSSLRALKHEAARNPEDALKQVARQFESIFVEMMVKSMRDAVPEGGLFGSNQMDTYQDMFDKQLAVDLASGPGLGLAEIIERQLGASTRIANAEQGDGAVQ